MRIICLLLLLAAAAAIAGAQLTPALTPENLDPTQCIAYDGDKALGAAPMDVLQGLLGLQELTGNGWSTGPIKGTKRYFRVAFTAPVQIGTICTSYAGATTVFWFGVNLDRTVSYLKPDAAYPGDVTKDEQWVTLPAGTVKTLPAGVKTRALRFAEIFPSAVATPSAAEYQMPPAQMGQALCLKERYYNVLTLGYTKIITHGKLEPQTWMGAWNKPRTLAGLVLLIQHGNAVNIDTLKPTVTEPAPLAPPEGWKSYKTIPHKGNVMIVRCDPPLSTAGLRVNTPGGGGDFAYNVQTLVALTGLADTEEPPSLTPPLPPFKIPYDMPMDGCVAIKIIDKKTGNAVRRLEAEVDRKQGKVLDAWDLKDDLGQYVPPGEYTWVGTACPPLKLTYQTTVNNAGNPPWWAPVRGGGSWMADESPPLCAGAIDGKTLLFGSVVCEKGQVAIATDLEGNKLWGESPVLGPWGGGYRIASDGRFGYIINNFGIQRVDPQQSDFAPTEAFKFNWSPEIPGATSWGGADLGGAAAHGDKLYIAYNASPPPWITPAIKDGIDPKRCLPYIRNTHEYRESEYDDITRLNTAFGLDAPSSTVAYFGDAPTAGALSGTLTVVFKKPTPVGSVFLPDAGIKVYALKPGQKLADDEPSIDNTDLLGGGNQEEEDKFDAAKWVPLISTGKAGAPGLAVLEKGMQTEALRYQASRLTYALVLNRRFKDVAPDAERVPLEGTLTNKGGWKVERPPDVQMNADNPAVLGMVWKAPQTLRGASLHMPTTASLAVDVFTGGDTDDPKALLSEDSKWKQVGAIQVEIFKGYWPQAPTMRNIDFGDNVRTRALRFRAVLAAGVLGVQGFTSAVKGPQKAGFEGIVVYSHLEGGDPELPQVLNERITELKLPPAQGGKADILRHLPLAKPGYIAFDKDGTLYAISDGRLVTVPLEGDGKPKEVLPQGAIEKPGGIAFAVDGLLYAVDQGPSVVKVFDVKTGKLVRTIGTPGGMKLGTYDPTRFNTPADLAIDGNGKLWVVESCGQPKRVTRWSRDGKLEKQFMGPTNYGGGGFMGGAGWLDPNNRSLFYFDGMKFVIDWKTYEWKLDSLVYTPGLNGPARSPTPNRVCYYQGHRYLVGDPRVYNEIAVICEEKNNIATPLVAAGNLTAWKNLNTYPGFRKALANVVRENTGFLWVDTNRDGIPQVDEVTLTTKNKLGPTYCACTIGEDLSLNFAGVRIPLQSIRADGLPLYDITKLQLRPLQGGSSLWTAADGSTFAVGNYLLAPDGQTKKWEYPDVAPGVQKSYPVPNPRPAGAVVAQFEVLGHFTVNGEEFYATNNNFGDWYLFTKDGLLATWIFGGPEGHGRRHWTMPEWQLGKTDLSGVRMDAEDFFGSMLTAEDGNVYLSAGGNHNSIVRVDGLERLKRLGGVVTVTPADLEKAKMWVVARATFDRAFQEPKVGWVPYIAEGAVTLDGSLDDWPSFLFLSIHDHIDPATAKTVVDAEAALAYNSDHLFLAARASDLSPLKNNGGDFQEMFKHGDAVDVTLGLDPKAPQDRLQPVDGDLRLLISEKDDKPLVVLYRPVAADTPAAQRVRYYTPAGGEAWMDVVKVIEDAEVTVQRTERGWTLEAAIPWKSLGVTAPPIQSKLRGDIGLLLSDDNGVRTVERQYWAGKTQITVSDVPTEARLQPALWGDLYFIEPDKSIRFGPNDVEIGP